MSDEKTNEGDTGGKEVVKDTPEAKTNSKEPSPLEEADRINKEKAVLLDREEKLQDRKEKLVAIQQVGGQTVAGQEPEQKKEDSPTEYVDKVMAGEVGNEKA